MAHQANSVEETVSQFLPALRLLEELSGPWAVGEEPLLRLPGLVESSLQRLYRLQNRDGGWGWVEGDVSQSYHTGYVVLGLEEARDAGYPVNERVLDRGLEFLRKISLETLNVDEKAYITYVLSECQKGDLSLARSLSERRRHMSLYAQAYLALALSNMGDEAAATRIADDLTAAVVETAHTAHWTEEEHYLAAMSSDGRTTAAVLQALAVEDPENRLLDKAANWLMWERDGGFWRSTYETAQIVSSLTDYVALTGEDVETTGYRVYLDGDLVAEGAAMPDAERPPRAQITRQLSPGEHLIEAEVGGSSPVYLASVLEYYAEGDGVEAARSSTGARISRWYEVARTGESLHQCAPGDLLRVRLQVEMPVDAWYAVLEDRLPPGTELVDVSPLVRLEGDASGARLRAHAESLSDRLGFYGTWLPAGAYETSYLVRATTRGEFRVMPAEMTLVYEPGAWGRSASAFLNVGGKP
ncbi:MAG TPA: hypothetical protein ENO24_09150 [Chloroflexi bacterium]|nr:hypothetical protein [Chloroflexota bacterium]